MMNWTKTEIIDAEDGFRSLVEEVKKGVGGGKVILFAEEGREADDATAALAVEGFTVLRNEVSGKTLSDYASFAEKSYPECVSAIIGVGGAAAMECAKCFKKSRALGCFLLPTDLSALNALNDVARFWTTKGLAVFQASARTVLLDKKKLVVAPYRSGALGLFLARFIGVWDGAYERLIQKGESPFRALSALKESSLKLSDISEENCAEKTYEAILALEKAIAADGLFVSDPAETLAALSPSDPSRGYLGALFVASYALLRLYSFFLKQIPLECAVPPDRLHNARLLFSLCGVGDGSLLSAKERYAEGAEDRRYLTAEYREDFLRVLSEDVLPLAACCRAYRRLVKKEKGKMTTSSERILTLVSLTGELVSGYPLIKHIKTTGLIEPLLSCG